MHILQTSWKMKSKARTNFLPCFLRKKKVEELKNWGEKENHLSTLVNFFSHILTLGYSGYLSTRGNKDIFCNSNKTKVQPFWYSEYRTAIDHWINISNIMRANYCPKKFSYSVLRKFKHWTFHRCERVRQSSVARRQNPLANKHHQKSSSSNKFPSFYLENHCRLNKKCTSTYRNTPARIFNLLKIRRKNVGRNSIDGM